MATSVLVQLLTTRSIITTPTSFRRLTSGLACLGLLAAGPVWAQLGAAPSTLTVQVNKPGAPVSKSMYNLFFEDINFAADGGLYPELVKNKSFENDDHLIGWKAIKGAAALQEYTVLSQQPLSVTNNHFLRLTARASSPDAGFVNESYRGMQRRRQRLLHGATDC